MLIFDDSIEHEAWNKGTETRVVLLFEVWRPEIDPHEREALTRLFQAIDLFGPGAVDTGDRRKRTAAKTDVRNPPLPACPERLPQAGSRRGEGDHEVVEGCPSIES